MAKINRSDAEWMERELGVKIDPIDIIPDHQTPQNVGKLRNLLGQTAMHGGLPADVRREQERTRRAVEAQRREAKKPVSQKPKSTKSAAKPTVRTKVPTVVVPRRRPPPNITQRVRPARRVNIAGLVQTVVVLCLLVLVWVVIQQMQGDPAINPAVPTPSLPGAVLIATIV